MTFIPKRGTVWLLQRLKAGEPLTTETANELMDYIRQLEVSQDFAKRQIRKVAVDAIMDLLERDNFDVVYAALKEPDEFHVPEKKEFNSENSVEVCVPDDLEVAIADLAYYNKTGSESLIVKILSFAANHPGIFGLIDIPQKTPEML